MPYSQDTASPIRMSGVCGCGRLAQGTAQIELARIWLDGDEGIQMRSLQIRSQTFLIEPFRTYVVIPVAHIRLPFDRFRAYSIRPSKCGSAPRFWAKARLQGLPTTSPAALDADALIAAQSAAVQGTVVTSNSGHIGRWVPVHPWP